MTSWRANGEEVLMAGPMFEKPDDYNLALLKLMAELPDGTARKRDVVDLFLERYRERIPPEHFKADGRDWRDNVGWSSFQLKQRGLMDGPQHGVWRISEAGRQWLKDHPGATIILNLKKREFKSTLGASTANTRARPSGKEAKVSADADTGQLAALRRIDDYLQGHAAERPSDDVLCDWIHFCYTLGLHSKVADLWPYVVREQVNPWYYERTQKIVRACRARLGR